MDSAPQILPKELRLGAPPQMPQARSYMFKQPSTLSSYTSSSQQTIQINIPRLQRSYLTKDSYLRFRLNLNQSLVANQGVAFDTCGAYGLFDKIEVFDYLGSTSLESITGHGQLMALLLDLHGDPTEMGSHMGISAGTLGVINGTSYTNTVAATSIATAGTNVGDLVSNATTGEVLLPATQSGNSSARITKEFCIPLLSFLGLLSTKYAPLHNGYTILLTLNQPATCFVSFGSAADSAKTALSAYTLSEVNLQCQVLELGPEAETMLLSSTGGRPMVVHTKTMRRYTGTVKAQPEFRLPLNLNVSSLTNILWFMRSKQDIDNAYAPSLGNRIRAFLQNWYFQYGSSILPQTTGINAMASNLGTNNGNTALFAASGAISDFSKYQTYSAGYKENYAELLKARHLWDSVDHKIQITPNNYEWDQCWSVGHGLRRLVNANSYNSSLLGAFPNYADYTSLKPYTPGGIGKFACGLELELVNGKSANMIAGLNTNGMNTMIAGRFHPDYYSKLYTAVPPVAITGAATTGSDVWSSVSFAGTAGTQDTIVIDAFAEYDAYINISPGIATTVSF